MRSEVFHMTTPVTPEIVVEIALLQSEAGGRKGPILQGEYRGVLGVGEEHFSVRFFVPLEDGIAPGQAQRLGVQFLVPQAALPHFPVGVSFTLWEGRTIGHGQVLEILCHV
jgi:hypothetical protein